MPEQGAPDLPPDAPTPLRPRQRSRPTKFDTVVGLVFLGIPFIALGVGLLWSWGAALVTLGVLLLALAVAAHRTLEDE